MVAAREERAARRKRRDFEHHLLAGPFESREAFAEILHDARRATGDWRGKPEDVFRALRLRWDGRSKKRLLIEALDALEQTWKKRRRGATPTTHT